MHKSGIYLISIFPWCLLPNTSLGEWLAIIQQHDTRWFLRDSWVGPLRVVTMHGCTWREPHTLHGITQICPSRRFFNSSHSHRPENWFWFGYAGELCFQPFVQLYWCQGCGNPTSQNRIFKDGVRAVSPSSYRPFNLFWLMWFLKLFFLFFCPSSRGTASNEDSLFQKWKECNEAIKSSTGSVVLHLGKLPVGLCKHRSLLFKVCLLV